MKLFLFGIGGTGARVLRSLTMLLASGANAPADLTIIPILLDMDMQNGDTDRTLKAVELYRAIRKGAYTKPEDQKTFFKTPLEPLGTLQAQNTQQKLGDSVMPRLLEHQGTFEDYLRVSELEEVDRELLKLFYDNSSKPSDAELKLNLTVGFKGNPNIGSVVFNSLEDSPVYKYFTDAFNDQTDRIFIVSSIFGGTGSAGFPQLVKLLQDSNQKIQLRNARKGAVTLMPYFALQQNAQSAIDQNRFMSKTKAALSYYQQQINLDSLYYIGDQPGAKPYQNIEGGAQQINKAHVVEMLAAEAVLDFARRSPDDFSDSKKYFEYGLKRNDHVLGLAHFYDSTYQNLLEPLLRMGYATKFVLDFLPRNLGEAFAKNLQLAQTYNSSTFYVSLKNFLDAHFKVWLTEMADNDRSFQAIDLNRDFNAMILSKQIETGWFEKGINDSFLLNAANKAESSLQAAYPQPEPRFMQMLAQVAEKCREKLGGISRELAA